MAAANDGITKRVYHIQVIKPYNQNTEVLKIELDNHEITDKFNEQGNLKTIVYNDQVVIDIVCQVVGKKDLKRWEKLFNQ